MNKINGHSDRGRMGHAVAMDPMQPVDHISHGNACVPSKQFFDRSHLHGVTLADV